MPFDYEVTLLTVRHAAGTSFCEPIGHLQVDGDYRESWQPQPMTPGALAESQRVAEAVTGALGGSGHLRRRTLRQGRRRLVQRGLAPPARHRHGHARLAGPLRVRACTFGPSSACPSPRVRQFGPAASCALLVDGDLHHPSPTKGSGRSSRLSPTRRCASSANRRSPATGAWASPSPSAQRSKMPAPRPAAPPPRSVPVL